MAKRAGGESLAVDVFSRLRTEILNRGFAPGQRLKSTELAERFGVSISVLREALGLLAAQHLVRIDRNRGFHVVELSVRRLDELTVARKVNEGAALRLSVTAGDVTWESEVLAAHHLMASQPMVVQGERLLRNEEWARAQMSSRIGSVQGGEQMHRDVAGEHRALLEAALAHDAERAVSLLDAHVERTRVLVRDFNVSAVDEPGGAREQRRAGNEQDDPERNADLRPL
jgi:DNA-binding GntR family transcriptional regulator